MTRLEWGDPAAASAASAEELQRLKEKFDLPHYAGKFTRLFRDGPRAVRGACPLHGGDNPTRFRIKLMPAGHWRWQCFGGCGEGTAVDFFMQHEQIDEAAAIRRLREEVTGQPQIVRTYLPPERPRNATRLAANLAVDYHRRLYDDTSLLETVTDPKTGLAVVRPMKAWDIWQARGITEEVIERFLLGYCPHCPSAKDKHNPDATFDSLTIPIFAPGGTELLTLRHRVLQPTGTCGKYLPHRAGDGAHLFNADALGETEEQAVGILEGEIKVLFWYARGLGGLLPVVSSTGGITGWDHPEAEEWLRRFVRFRTVYVLFDPEADARERASRLAKRFGRRGRVVALPQKVDDLLVRMGDEGVEYVIRALGAAARR